MSGKRSRTKGHSYERAIAKRFRDAGVFPKAERQLEYQINQCEGVDLKNTGALRIQCKRLKNYAPVSKIEEVKRDGIPVLISKADRKEDVVCLYLDDFIKIISDIGEVYTGGKNEGVTNGSQN